MICNTVIISIGCCQRVCSCCIVQSVAIFVDEVVNLAVAIGVDSACFRSIGQTIVITVQIEPVCLSITIGIDKQQWAACGCVIEAIVIFINEAIDDTVAILIKRSGFKRIG